MLRTLEFKGKSYQVTSYGANAPEWLWASFRMEEEIREKWWNPEEGQYIIDVGAGYGSYTLPALAHGASVLAIEPSKDEFFDLCVNLLINGFDRNCLPVAAVAAEQDGVFDNFYPRSHSFMVEGHPEYRYAFRLDSLASRNRLDRIDWIKIDVEGYELQVLSGAEGIIDRFHPQMLIENHLKFTPDVDRLIRGFLQPKGYVEENMKGQNPNENWSYWKHAGHTD